MLTVQFQMSRALTTKSLNAGCVQIRTRWPCGGACSSFAIGIKGCTSPRDPQMCIAMFSRGVPRLLFFSLMNSSTRAVLPRRGLARCAGRHAAASFWTLSNQYFSCAVSLWNWIATWPKVLILPELCALSSWKWPCFCLLLKLRGIALQAATVRKLH